MSNSVIARIAQLVSQTVITTFPQISGNHASNLMFLSSGEDPVAAIRRAFNSESGLVSLTASDCAGSLPKLLLPHAGDLSSLPIVIHIEVRNDFSSVSLLHSAFPFFLLSVTPLEAHDNSIIASYLATSLGLAVIHAYSRNEDATSGTGMEIPKQSIVNFVHKEMGKDLSSFSDIDGRWRAYEVASSSLSSLTSRTLHPLASHSSGQDSEVNIVVFVVGHHCMPEISTVGVRLIYPKIITPLPSLSILEVIPPSTSHVFVLEQLQDWSMKWTPFYLEVIRALQQRGVMPIVRSGILGSSTSSITDSDIEALLSSVNANSPAHRVQLGSFTSSNPITPPLIPKHESCYLEMLKRLFGTRFELSNSPSMTASHGRLATNPEFALGRVRGQFEEREKLIKHVAGIMHNSSTGKELHSLLSKWYRTRDDVTSHTGEEVAQTLEHSLHCASIEPLLAMKHHFCLRSRWIVVSSTWSHDLGSSGLHHILSSGLPVNLLVLHTTPYTLRRTIGPRQHDIGLYAMNYGSAYVASVAIYSSYAHTMRVFVEADRFKGPSVVLGYLPYQSENTSAVDILKETKLAVDSGYWPLYRWDPSKDVEGEDVFSLDSPSVKNDLAQFLDRQNHLSQLVRSKPALAPEIVGSLGQTLKEARQAKARETYNKLVSTIDAPPMRILYASDGGGAKMLANRLAARGKIRGLEVSASTLDSMSLDSLSEQDGYVVFITSTAGQGEPPLNGRKFFKALNTASLSAGGSLLSKLRYMVFGLGDSRYWPRPEDAQYFNKPSKDLDSKLALLGAKRILPLDLGDAQDPNGHETQYKVWEAQVWKVFGVDSVEVSEKEPETITLEHVKAASNFLRGTIAEGIADRSTGGLAPSDPPLTKYHGIWQQDDRDVREARQAQGVELAYNFMVRARMTGGLCTPEQWLKLDRLAEEYGNGTMKITTRQTLQFHGILKQHLKRSIQEINRALLDTLEVGGDVNSNIVCSSISTMPEIHAQVHDFCMDISERLMPRTTAYHEIWLDKKMVAGHAVKDLEPIYSEWYLPRKFKIAVAVPPTNDVDVFTNDLGYIAIIDDNKILGYNVLVGGGLGITLGNKKTYPRIASIIGFCTPEQAVDVAEKVTLVQRDFGDRLDRKTARVKYTVDRMGLDNFKAEVEKRLGFSLQKPRPFTFNQNLDNYGWAAGANGKHYFTVFIENGRIQDSPNKEMKTGLREIAKVHKGTFRLTTNQHFVVSEVESGDVSRIKDILSKYNMDTGTNSGLRLASSACVSFPSCGLAMAESERYLPILIDKLEKICEENGLRNDTIGLIRMTGCPAGCSRPNVADIGFIGKAPGAYVMLLGGGAYGQRLAKVYRENVTEREILAILEPMIKHYALDRRDGERFGEFVIRVGYVPAVTDGQEWM